MPNFEDDSGNCHAPDPNGVACYKSRIGCPIHPRQKRKRHKCSELSALRLNNDRLRAENERLRAEIERLKREPELLRAELISLANAARKALADAYDRAREVRDAFQQQAP